MIVKKITLQSKEPGCSDRAQCFMHLVYVLGDFLILMSLGNSQPWQSSHFPEQPPPPQEVPAQNECPARFSFMTYLTTSATIRARTRATTIVPILFTNHSNKSPPPLTIGDGPKLSFCQSFPECEFGTVPNSHYLTARRLRVFASLYFLKKSM